MHRVLGRGLRRGCVQVLLAALFIASVTSSAQAQTLNRDIDLTTLGLFNYSQNDFRWSRVVIGGNRDVRMANCGCLLAVLSTVLNFEMRGVTPWFPVPLPTGGSAFDFNPIYLDAFLNLGPAGNRPLGWGYKPMAANTCGVLVEPEALRGVAQLLGQPFGVGLRMMDGRLGTHRTVIDRNLNAGRPTIVVREFTPPNGRPQQHAQLIVGWDNAEQKYLALDPRQATGARPQIPLAREDGTYETWESNILGIIDVTNPGGGGPARWLYFGDDPSPIEILAINPDGRKTGFDPATGSLAQEDPSASYWNLNGWEDAFGQVPPGDGAKFTTIDNPADGIHRFLVQGTGNGPFTLNASVFLGDSETLLQTFTGLIALGDVRKYELHLSSPGLSFLSEVSNFSPEARAGSDVAGVTGVPIPFDARLSRDDDGAIVSHVWNFGDGTTASGSAVSHVYPIPGTYTVTLTVTDSAGLTATDTLQASVVLAQQRPVARASGPYLGLAPPAGLEGFFYILFKWQGSFDPNGDPLTARWDFGDGSPIEVTAPGLLGFHTYLVPGTYTVTLVVNDGFEDSEPATTTVEVLPWQNPPSNGFGTVALAPGCGASGTTVRFTVGGLAVAPPEGGWNFEDGRLPEIPRRITLGIPNTPDGHLRITFDGVRYFVPWVASMTSAAEFALGLDFVIPDQPPGQYQFILGEGDPIPFEVPCQPPSNHRPVADAGGPYAGAVGAAFAFNGAASSDADGDALTYRWDFGDGTFGSGIASQHAYQTQGTYFVSLVVNDGQEDSFPADTRGFATATVTGTATNTAPTFSHADITTPATSASGAVVTFTANGSDAEQGSVPAICTPSSGSTFPIGPTAVHCTVTDSGGLTGSGSFTVTVTDTGSDRTGPTITGMPGAGCSLWPPNHKLVTVARVSASDAQSGLAPNGLVLTATSSEPEDALGDGNTGPDVVITGGLVALRAERSGTGIGRTYTITAIATDRAGNTTSTVSTCVVPHDQGP